MPEPTRRPTSANDDDSKLVVVGDSPRADRVAARLERLRPVTVRTQWPPQPQDLAETDIIGLVLVAPVSGANPELAFRTLRKRVAGRELPIFVVTAEAIDDAATRRLYRAGAAAVFTWRRDDSVLALVLAESLGIVQARGVASSGTVALARTVKAYLRNAGVAAPRLRIEVDDGIVHLSGQVRDLRTKLQIAELVAEVAGVAGVDSTLLGVEPSGLTDRAILANLRAVLRAVSEVSEETLSVSVDNGLVSVAGSVGDRREMDSLCEVMSHVRGVRGIHNLATISRRQKANDRLLTSHLREQIAGRFGRERATVSAFGGVAVVTGKVSSPVVRRQIAAVLSGHPWVRHVVNKLTVD